jgi:hypothetical protein
MEKKALEGGYTIHRGNIAESGAGLFYKLLSGIGHHLESSLLR